MYREPDLSPGGNAFESILFDLAPGALLVYDEGMERLLAINAVAADLFESSRSDMMQMDPVGFHGEEGEPPEEVRYRLKVIASQVVAGQGKNHDVWIKTAQGSHRRCELRMSRLQVRNRTWIYANYTDVSARQGPPRVQPQSNAHLQQAVHQLQLLLDNVQDAVISVDPSGVVRSFNPAASRLFGHAAADVLGRHADILLPNATARRHFRHWCRYEAFRRDGKAGTVIERKLRHRDGSAIPVRVLTSAAGSEKQPICIGLLKDTREQQATQAHIHQLAYFDALTGLPNRRQFMDCVTRAQESLKRHGGHAVLIVADIDEFKAINNTLGHAAGDELLREIGERFGRRLRGRGVASRLGGDEFAFLIESLDQRQELAQRQVHIWCQRLLRLSKQGFGLHGHDYRTSASLGAVLFGSASEAPDVLMAHADLAMYQSKSESRDTYRIFDPDLASEVNRRAQSLNDLRVALPNGELALSYQPQVNARGEVVGAEALLRWLHPTRGPVSPVEFIPLAEQSGLIVDIGHWVLGQACMTLARWAKHPETESLTLAINISAAEFRDPQFVFIVSRAFEGYGIQPGRLKLELTESVLTFDLEELAHKLDELKRLGIGIALDDFGTGYSSISYLRNLPIDQIKIDRSFIVDLEKSARDRVIVEGLIEFCHILGFSVIAEGVEAQAQCELLGKIGCQYFQGFLTGRPMWLDELESLASTTHRAGLHRVSDSSLPLHVHLAP